MRLDRVNATFDRHAIVPFGSRYAIATYVEPLYGGGGEWQCTSKRGYGYGRTPRQAVMAACWDGGERPLRLFRTIAQAVEAVERETGKEGGR